MREHRRHILLVEDEYLIGLFLEDMLSDLGHSLGEITSRLDAAVTAAQSGAFDLALLDLSLAGVKTYPVADVLKQRGIPFAFLTGYGSGEIDSAYAAVPVLHKPFGRPALAALIAQLASQIPD
jgi:CheY-like chemotaxis protein